MPQRSGTPEVKKLLEFLNKDMLGGGPKQIRADSAVAIKPISPFGTKRLMRRAIQYALENKKRVVTIMHKGNIQKFTEGAFRDWGYELAVEEFRAQTVTERETWILGNRDKDPKITIEQHAALVEPGLEQGTEAFKKSVSDEVRSVLDKIYASHGRSGKVETEAADQRPHRRLRFSAGDHARRRISKSSPRPT